MGSSYTNPDRRQSRAIDSTALTPIPCPVLSIGQCISCKRHNQHLANGVCQDCRFYGIGPARKDKGHISNTPWRGGRRVSITTR